ncbi:MAG: hypothetical protein Q7K16_04635 [Candidatus Azambacteria bacterium]|nr:hypothetical protein [Candidatus Azambacteria bacterium]
MDIGRKTFVWAIAGLIILRFFLIVLAMNNIPDTGMKDGGFRPSFTAVYQPDEPEFYQIANGLVSGRFEKRAPNIGAPLIFAPLIYFSGVNSPDQLAPYAFILQAFIIFSFAVIIVALIGRQILGSRLLGLAGAVLFTIYPWLFLAFFKIIGYGNAIPAFHYQLWIFILSDYLSAFWVYLSFYLLLRNFESTKKSEIKYGYLIILATASGLALLTRVGNFWLILIIFSIFLFYTRFKKAMIYGCLLALVYAPQLIFNFIAFGAPWIYGYRDPLVGASTSTTSLSKWFDPANLWQNFAKFSPHYYFWLFVFSAGFFIITFIYGYKYLAKVNKNFAIAASMWFWSYLIFYWIFDESLSQLRYFLPMIPAFIYFFVAAVVYLAGKFKKRIYV